MKSLLKCEIKIKTIEGKVVIMRGLYRSTTEAAMDALMSVNQLRSVRVLVPKLMGGS